MSQAAIMGPMDPGVHGPMDPWTHGPMDPWTHGPMGPWGRTQGPGDPWTQGPMGKDPGPDPRARAQGGVNDISKGHIVMPFLL